MESAENRKRLLPADGAQRYPISHDIANISCRMMGWEEVSSFQGNPHAVLKRKKSQNQWHSQPNHN